MITRTSHVRRKSQLSNTTKPQPEAATFSSDFVKQLTRTVELAPKNAHEWMEAHLKQCQTELQRLQEIKPSHQRTNTDQQLGLMAMVSQANAYLHHQHPSTLSPTSNSQSTLSPSIEDIINEIQRNQSLIRHFMEQQMNQPELNILECYQFFKKRGHSIRGNDRTSECISYLMQTVEYLLSQVLSKWQSQIVEQLNEEEEHNQEEQVFQEYPTFEEINHWKRLHTGLIEQKLTQMASVCQQIPQLQMLERNLQFWEVKGPHCNSVRKLTVTLISLHKRVGYLSRKRPELMLELEESESQLKRVVSQMKEWIQKLQGQGQLLPLRWEQAGGIGQLRDAIAELRSQVSKLAGLVVRSKVDEQEQEGRVERICGMVQLCVRVVEGEEEAIEQWRELSERLTTQPVAPFSALLGSLLRLLSLYQRPPLRRVQSEELQIEINKLIGDYESLKDENQKLIDRINCLTRSRQELMLDVEERDTLITSLNHTLEDRIKEEEQEKQAQVLIKKLQQQMSELAQQKEKLQIEVDMERRQKQESKKTYFTLMETHNHLTVKYTELQTNHSLVNDEIQSLNNEHLRHTTKLNHQIAQLQQRNKELEEDYSQAEKQQQRLELKIQQLDKKIAQYKRLLQQRVEGNQQQQQNQRELERVRRQLHRVKEQASVLEEECEKLRQESNILKMKAKRPVYDPSEHLQAIQDLTNKLEKATSKSGVLRAQAQELRGQVEQWQNKYRILNKRVKALEENEREHEFERTRLAQQSEQRGRRLASVEGQLQEVTERLSRDLRVSRQALTRRELEVTEKTIRMEGLQEKLAALERQLVQRQQQMEDSQSELGDVKMRQFESTIEAHKMMEMKLEEQAKGLKRELEEKVQVEIKLNIEIDKLSREIDRMKNELERHMRELSEKEVLIREEQRKQQEQLKPLRDLEVKQKLRQEGRIEDSKVDLSLASTLEQSRRRMQELEGLMGQLQAENRRLRELCKQKEEKYNLIVVRLRELEQGGVDERQLIQLSRERDLMRNQHDKMRRHLEEETKRAMYLEGQISRLQEELRRVGATNAMGTSLQWWVRRVAILEEALRAVGDELRDSQGLPSAD